MPRQTAETFGDRRFHYIPFHDLMEADRRAVRRAYTHTGGKYAFIHEHYYYPVTRKGRLPFTRSWRVLAIPRKKIEDEAYMRSLGYKVNPNW
ncbi:MAG: hypothetical protein ACE5F6_00355 [Anaerolineae bacterium]